MITSVRKFRRDLPAVVPDDKRCNSRDVIMHRHCRAPMMTAEDNQDDRLAIYPQHASVIGDEGLSIACLMRDPHIFEIAGEAIIDLLLFMMSRMRSLALLETSFPVTISSMSRLISRAVLWPK